MTFTHSMRLSTLVVVTWAAVASPAQAQSPTPAPAASTDDVPTIGKIFSETFFNFSRLPSIANLGLVGIGGVAALAAHRADSDATRALAERRSFNEPFKAGAVLGGTPFELGAAVATYGLGRAFKSGRVARVGADLIEAQLMAESLAIGVKQAARRARPEGSGFSFPSGHTTVTFASATVLQHHFGWKVGIPAYAVASYVATSRVQQRRHYLSDVAFGAALGALAGRTVTLGRHHALSLTPVASRHSAGIVFSVLRP